MCKSLLAEGPVSCNSMAERKEQQPTSQVNTQLEVLYKTIGMLNGTIDDLRAKLNSVVEDRPTCEEKSECKDTYLVPLASDIREANRLLLTYNSRLNDLIDSIKL